MIKFEHTEVLGWEHAIRGMRNPMNSWEKSDSEFSVCECEQWPHDIKKSLVKLGPNDLDLMKRLRNAGTDHRKFMRMIAVYVDILAPLYWWKEFDTYKVGTVANSCSTMHKIAAKEFTLEDFSCEHLLGTAKSNLDRTVRCLNYYRDMYLNGGYMREEDGTQHKFGPKNKDIWWQMIQLLPSSYNQRRTVMLNYEVLANIYKSRQNHKLDEWTEGFIPWIESLPYSEIIIGKPEEKTDIPDEIMEEAKRRVYEELKAKGMKIFEDFWSGADPENKTGYLETPPTPKEAWPSTPEEVAKALEEWDKIVEKIQNAEITSLDDFKKELGIESSSNHDKE